MNSVVQRYTLTLILNPPSKSNTSAKPSCLVSHRTILPKWRCISVQVRKVDFLAFQKTNCVCRFNIKIKLYCDSLTTDRQDYHFHRCYTCANIDFKATTGKQHKGEQFGKSSNGSAKNGKMAMYLSSS